MTIVVKLYRLHTCNLVFYIRSKGGKFKNGRSNWGMPSWTEEANCKGADADIFFPERGASTRKAKSICRACSVQEDCLEFAIEQSEKFGIWGGLSERERRRIKRQRVQSFDIREVS